MAGGVCGWIMQRVDCRRMQEKTDFEKEKVIKVAKLVKAVTAVKVAWI